MSNIPAPHFDARTAAEMDAAMADHRAGKLLEAEKKYRNVLARHPQHPDALHLLGVLAHQVGHHQAALELISKAIALKPAAAEFHGNFGLVLMTVGQVQQAMVSYQRALQLKPDNAEVYNNLGSAHQKLGALDQAVECFRKSLNIFPEYAEAYNNLGNALFMQGKFDAAVAAYRRASEIKPTMAEAFNNLGNGMLHMHKVEEALVYYDRALELNPRFATAFNNKGNALKEKFDYPGASACYEKAIALSPQYAEALNNLGNILKDTGRLGDALVYYRRSIACNPNFAASDSNLVYSVQFHPDYDAAAILAETRRWNRQHAKPLERQIRPHANDPTPGRKLRIGYISPDLRDHVVGRNLLPLIQNHDQEKFEIFCYAQHSRPDGYTARFQKSAGHFETISHMSDDHVADLVRNDKIDILVDLALHMSANRLLVFARKPAPIQVTFGGYPGTTGMDAIDYRLSDPFLDPPGETDAFYREQTLRLPDSFWCYDPQAMDAPAQPPTPLPALGNGFVTFGCLNNFCKVNDPVVDLWARVMQAVAGSRLILLIPAGPARQRIAERLLRAGIASDRLEFNDRVSREKYLQSYQRIDLGLDTFPYNGHTTSLDSIWMGVPVVTLIGPTVVGRAGWSQLCNLGLKELAADTPEQFVRIAADWAGDLPRMAQLREGLRRRMEGSVLCDGPRFARGIESAYRDMWHKWCASRGNQTSGESR